MNSTFLKLTHNIRKLSTKKFLWNRMMFSGIDSNSLNDIQYVYPYFTRDLTIYGNFLNDDFVNPNSYYRYEFKKMVKKFIPPSILQRNGKSRVDSVLLDKIKLNSQYYIDIISNSELSRLIEVEKILIIDDLKKCLLGESHNIMIVLRFLVMAMWIEKTNNKYFRCQRL